MNNFTNFTKLAEINETAKRIGNSHLTVKDINNYITAVGKNIPSVVSDVIYLTGKYNLTDIESLEEIRFASKSNLSSLSAKLNIPINELEDLWENLKSLKANIRLLPQYQTSSEREAFMAGKLKMSDINIDLESSTGRNACAKMYMPMVHKIVNQFVGRCKLSKPELMSAGLQGFTDAMNDWRKNDNEENNVPFKTYAAYRIKQQIQNDITEYSYAVKTNWYGVQKMGSELLNAVSLDSMPKDEDGEFKQDHFKILGKQPNYNLTDTEERNWDELYKLIENTFKQRDVDIFYRYFGLKDYNKEKAKDIAKSMGISSQLVSNVVKDVILKKLKQSPKAMEILMDLLSSYNESLMLDIMNLDKQMMIEAILADDTFILLEELTRWSNKDVYINTVENALNEFDKKEISILKDILSEDFNYLDKNYKTYKKIIIKFLTIIYPTESFNRKSDVAILQAMQEISDLYKTYYKK